MMTWHDDMSVGDDLMDGQHKSLIALINQLDDALRRDDGQEVVVPVLAELVAYARCHFADEEALMRDSGFPGLVAHQTEHLRFVADVREMQRAVANGTVLMTDAVMNFIIDWLRLHILKRDKEYAAYHAQRAASATRGG